MNETTASVLTYIIAIITFGSIFFVSCKTKTVYVPVESVKIEYINKYTRDSIRLYDSIYVRDKGDTVLIEKYKNLYVEKLRIDTVLKVDSINTPYPVIEYVEVNKLKNWQIGLMILGGVFIGCLVYKAKKKFFP